MTRRTKRRIFAVAAVTIAAALIAAHGSDEPYLLDRASRIADVAEWNTDISFWWLNSDEILYVQGNPISLDSTPHLRRFRRATGLNGADTRITPLFAKHPGEFLFGGMSVSPDGSWLISRAFTCRTDGSAVTEMMGLDTWCGSPFNTIWYSDSRHVLIRGSLLTHFNQEPNHSVAIHTLGTTSSGPMSAASPPQSEWLFPEYRLSGLLRDSTGGHTDIEPGRAVVTRENYLVAWVNRYAQPDRTPAATADLVRWKVTPGGRGEPELQRWTVHAPQEMLITHLALSPEGDRLAYLVSGTPRPPLPELAYRLFPTLKKPGPIAALWISRLDGTDLREIGRIGGGNLSHVQWLPGSREVSFISGDILYAVNVQ